MSDHRVTWLHAQLDNDERVARAAGGEHPTWIQGGPDWIEDEGVTMLVRPDEAGVVNDAGETVVYDEGRDPKLDTHIARHDPDRVLKQVAADRLILDEHAPESVGTRTVCTVCADPPAYEATWRIWPCRTVRLLASRYADEPGYQETWRP